MKRSWRLVASEAYPDVRLLAGALLGVFGNPGAGKSTWLLRFLAGLRGPVVLYCAEEGLGPAVSERLGRLAIRRDDFYLSEGGSVDALLELVAAKGAEALAIDSVSVTTFTARDLRKILSGCRELKLLAFAVQVTKAGIPAGANALLHEADVLVHCEKMSWEVEKTRYSAVGAGGAILETEVEGEHVTCAG